MEEKVIKVELSRRELKMLSRLVWAHENKLLENSTEGSRRDAAREEFYQLGHKVDSYWYGMIDDADGFKPLPKEDNA